MQLTQRVIHAFHEDRFRELEFDVPRSHRVPGEARFDHRREARVAQLQRRHIERQREAVAAMPQSLGGPLRELAARLVQHPRADGVDEAALLGDGNEPPRRDGAQLRMLPAQERFDAAQAAGGGIDARLIVQRKLVALDRAAQARLHVEPLLGAQVEILRDVVHLVAAAALGLVHRHVGMAHQVVDILPVLRIHGHANAAAQRTTLSAAGSGAITASGLTMATARVLGRTTASTGAVEELSQVPYSLGGTNATTSWTQGSILFAGASALAQDNTNLYCDDTNNFLGVGGTPSYRLDVQHNTNAAHGIAMRNASTGASSQSFIRCETGTTNAFFNVACLDNAGAPYAQFSVGSAITALFFLSDTQVWSNSSGVEMGRITASALTATGNAGILTGTAIPAGGTAGSGYKFSSTSNFGLFFGSGAPSLSAARGSFYLRSDGLAPYTNINGTTGWMPIYGDAGPVIKVADWTVADTEQSFVSNRGASNTVTLPTASSFPGRWIYIKTIQAQTVVSASSNVKPLVSDTAGTAILPATDGAWAALQSDGSNWILMMGSAV